MPLSFIVDGRHDAQATVLLAHGAGASMDSPAMNTLVAALTGAGLRIARFEFAYMAARRTGQRKPPPKAEMLIPEFGEAVRNLDWTGQLIIGGKSMGGRVTSMIADDLHAADMIAGLLCLGYPFHPPGKPGQLRTRPSGRPCDAGTHLPGNAGPVRDAQRRRRLLAVSQIEMLWIEDGDHDLRPRKAVAGVSFEQSITEMAAKVRDWVDRIPG